MNDRFVYFIRPVGQAGPVKIGCSYYPIDRLCNLQTWSPVPLEIIATVPGDFKLERAIHDALADTHSHREWFHASDRLNAAIASLQAGAKIEEAIDLSDVRGDLRARFYRHRSEVTAVKRGQACALPSPNSPTPERASP